MKERLKWKSKKCKDLSAIWLEAEVKGLGWTYIIDDGLNIQEFMCFLTITPYQEENCLTRKQFKTLEQAKAFCENHLESIYKNISKIFKS
jgi:hypothetical protein